MVVCECARAHVHGVCVCMSVECGVCTSVECGVYTSVECV